MPVRSSISMIWFKSRNLIKPFALINVLYVFSRETVLYFLHSSLASMFQQRPFSFTRILYVAPMEIAGILIACFKDFGTRGAQIFGEVCHFCFLFGQYSGRNSRFLRTGLDLQKFCRIKYVPSHPFQGLSPRFHRIIIGQKND